MRTMSVAVLLFMAGPAMAQSMGGLTLGMTEPEARSVMGPQTQEHATPEGKLIGVTRADGTILAATVCAADGSNRLSAISETLPNPSVAAFAKAVEALRPSLGSPQVLLEPERLDQGLGANVAAQWVMPGVSQKITLIEKGERLALHAAIIRACRK